MVAYATEQGLGYLAKSFYDYGLIDQVLIYQHPHNPTHKDWYPAGTPVVKRPFTGEVFERFLDDIEIVLFFETPFDWNYPNRCRERGVKTVMLPMYEWFLEDPPHVFDLFLCPSLLDVQYFPGSPFIPIPFPQEIWRERNTAKRFLHNSGHVGCREHKGTRELLMAMEFVKSPVSLTVRTQEAIVLRKILQQIPSALHDDRITFEFGGRPVDSLFTSDHDVYIAPEKFNGLSLPLQEACASGMVVMTTDRFPTNSWLPCGPLIPVSEYRKARAMRGHLEFDEAIVTPRDIAETIDKWYGQNITHLSYYGLEVTRRNSIDNLRPLYLEQFERLVSCP